MAWGRKKTAAQTPAWSQDDYHAEFAGKLKEQIEQGVAPWQKPWKSGERRLPENVASKKPYRGGNSVYLSVAQTAKGYSDPPLGHLQTDQGHGRSGPHGREGHPRALLQV